MERLQEITKKQAIMEFSKRRDLDWFSFHDGVNTKEAAYIVIAIALIFLATVGAGAAGYLIASGIPEITVPEIRAYTVMFGGLFGVMVGIVLYKWLLSAGSPSWEAQMKQVEPLPQGRSFAPSATNPRRSISLSEDDKRLLQTFASRYEVIGSMAINRWEGGSSPFDWWDNKTAAIKRVHSLIEKMGYGARTGINNGLELTADGLGKITDWRAGIFDEIPPTPEAA